MIRSLLLVAGLALGLSTQAAATAAEPTCSEFLNVSIADPGSPSPVELRQVLTVVRTAIAEQHVKNADAFPAQNDGVFGMMKGGGLKTVGYSKDGHANQPITFMDCLDACYDDCRCLGFHWSGKHARCGLKAEGNIPVLTDNRYQKTFRSFKRLVVKSCTPATTPEPTTTTPEPTTTTPEPTTTKPCSYINSTTTFEQAFTQHGQYFPNITEECAINNFDASAVTTMASLFRINSGNEQKWIPSFNENINGWSTGAVTDMEYMFAYDAPAFNQNINSFDTAAVTTMAGMFWSASAFNQNINGFNTGAVTAMNDMFKGAVAFNQTISNWDTGAVTTTASMFVGTLMTDEQKPTFTAQ